MKYFDELDNVETQVVRLSEMTKMYTVLVNGMLNGSSGDEIQAAFSYVEGSLQDISKELSEAFNELWETVAKDKEEKKKDKK